jgi:hypothetical protein
VNLNLSLQRSGTVFWVLRHCGSSDVHHPLWLNVKTLTWLVPTSYHLSIISRHARYNTGTIQDPTMHVARDKVTLLMKHQGSTQQSLYQPLDQQATPSGGTQGPSAHEPKVQVRRDGRSRAHTKGVRRGEKRMAPANARRGGLGIAIMKRCGWPHGTATRPWLWRRGFFRKCQRN